MAALRSLGEWHWNMYNIIYETSRQSRFDAWYWMLGAGALGRPRGMVWGWRREEGSGWGTHVYLWQIHFDIWQNEYNIVKLNKIKKKRSLTNWPDIHSRLFTIWSQPFHPKIPVRTIYRVLLQCTKRWGDRREQDSVFFSRKFILVQVSKQAIWIYYKEC